MNAIATGTGLNNAALIALLNASPSTAAGRNATIRLTTNARAFGSDPSPSSTPVKRARYSHRIASIAPVWMTISKT